MANPQKENGYTAIANEILEHLLLIETTSVEIRAILFVIRKTYGFQKKIDRISLSQFEKNLHCDHTTVCRVLKRLVARRLLVKSEKGYGFNKDWETWVVARRPLVANGSRGSGKPINLVVARRPHTKETITKERTTKETSVAKAPQEDLRKIVNKYFDLQSYEEADRKASFPRHVRDAKALLQACGGDSGRAVAVLDALHEWGSKKKLSYTIGTALKRWKDFSGTAPPGETWDERMARINAEVEKYKLEHGL